MRKSAPALEALTQAAHRQGWAVGSSGHTGAAAPCSPGQTGPALLDKVGMRLKSRPNPKTSWLHTDEFGLYPLCSVSHAEHREREWVMRAHQVSFSFLGPSPPSLSLRSSSKLITVTQVYLTRWEDVNLQKELFIIFPPTSVTRLHQCSAKCASEVEVFHHRDLLECRLITGHDTVQHIWKLLQD